MRIMIDFLKTHQQDLEIQLIELDDNSHHRCHENPSDSIGLELSRQLEGDQPYYTQFGFQPKERSARQKLLHNHQRMSQIKTVQYPILLDLCRTHGFKPDLLDYIHRHRTDPMIKTLKYLSRHDCSKYSEIYRVLFRNFGLEQLGGNETIYILML